MKKPYKNQRKKCKCGRSLKQQSQFSSKSVGGPCNLSHHFYVLTPFHVHNYILKVSFLGTMSIDVFKFQSILFVQIYDLCSICNVTFFMMMDQ